MTQSSPALNDALIVIATVAVVAWTGGFFVAQQAKQPPTLLFIFAMNELQLAFFAPVVVLLTTAETLRIIACLFFVYYFLLFLYTTIRYVSAPTLQWFLLKALELIPILVICIFPEKALAASLCAGALFAGYQCLLPPFYDAWLSAIKS